MIIVERFVVEEEQMLYVTQQGQFDTNDVRGMAPVFLYAGCFR